MPEYDLIVLGAGAAGLMCAARAGSGGCRVLVLEHNDRPGKKIRISGGGRCNFTNREVRHTNFLSSNPDFARSALSRYGSQDFIDMVDAHGITWHEKTLGQLFCDGSAQQIIDMLTTECRRGNVEILYRSRMISIAKSDGFAVEVEHDGTSRSLRAASLIVATGGLSIPSLGATDIGYRIARQFGHPIVEPLPALVPLTFHRDFVEHFGGLSGVSCQAEASTAEARFRENILFTHRGMSGPAILQISSYLGRSSGFSIDLLPSLYAEDIIDDYPSERRLLRTVLSAHLPSRLLDAWESPLLDQPVNASSRREIESLISGMKNWHLEPAGTEGYAKAEVTSGGVCTSRLSSKTMQSTLVDGLYFIGEVVDMTGWLGGYNFQWAWSSAVAAADAVVRMREV